MQKKDLFYSSPDYGKAIKAAEKIFQLLNRKPTIDNGSNIGDEIVSEDCKYCQYILYSSSLV
jgi:hypothetical protein